MKRSLFANSLWNLLTGLSAAVVALAVPPVLSRTLSAEAFGAWALALQIGAYVNLAGLALQVAVGRFTGLADARDDPRHRDRITATAFWILTAVAMIGLAVALLLARHIDWLLPAMTAPVRADMALALPVLALSFGSLLPTTVLAGVFNGLQRSDVPAKVLSAGRLLTAALLTGALLAGGRQLFLLSILHLLASILTSLALWWRWKRTVPGATLAPSGVRLSAARELALFCTGLLVWNFAMLMINGFDLLIVGRFDGARLAALAAGATLASFIAGVLSALAMPVVPEAAALLARAPDQLAGLLARTSRLVLAASILVTLPLLAGREFILATWLGPEWVDAAGLFAWLLIAAFTRNLMLPYAMIAIGTGQQNRMLLPPIAEGLVCITGSLLLAPRIGAMGVIVAKMAGAVVGVSLVFLQHALKQPIPALSRGRQLRGNILLPLLAAVPGALLLLLWRQPGAGWPGALAGALVFLLTLAAAWRLALAPDDRALVRRTLAARLRWRQAGASNA